jgi:murein L,D-transpeptidase YafK
LAMKINYPNVSDAILGTPGQLGGDICIHGNCCTIGCIPLTDDKIKEVYLFALEAFCGGQKQVPVYIFPSSMDPSHYTALISDNKPEPAILKFWQNLKTGFDLFEKNHTLLNFKVNTAGEYVFD